VPVKCISLGAPRVVSVGLVGVGYSEGRGGQGGTCCGGGDSGNLLLIYVQYISPWGGIE